MAFSSKYDHLSFSPSQMSLLPSHNSPTAPTSHLQFLPSPPSKTLSILHLRTQLTINTPVSLPQLPPLTNSNTHTRTQQKEKSAAAAAEQEKPNTIPLRYLNFDSLSVAFPSLAFANTLFFSSAYNYNVQVIVENDEPEDRLVARFRREVSKAGVLRECKRRMFFETSQEKRKRKTREAAIRYRKRTRPQRKELKQVMEAPSKKKTEKDSEDDNWELFDLDLPYC